MLHVASDDERKKLAALDGLKSDNEVAEHYGDEILADGLRRQNSRVFCSAQSKGLTG